MPDQTAVAAQCLVPERFPLPVRQSRLLLLLTWGHFRALVPPVEGRELARVPGFAESGRAQIPVGADLTRHGAQVVPEIDGGRAAPEPVAVVDAVDYEARLEHERVRDHRIVLGVGI